MTAHSPPWRAAGRVIPGIRVILCAVVLSLFPLFPLLASVDAASAEAPLCALAPEFEREAIRAGMEFGAAVYELDTGIIWSGGDPGPYALHSTVKPPIAWAVMTDALEHERELTELQREAIFYMVAWSRNADVLTLLSMIGGLQGLGGYYKRWGAPELVALQHARRWGSGRAAPLDLARLYAALATSRETPEPVRAEGFDLLRAVVDQHLWGATIPDRRLVGWEALIKTGNYMLPEPQDGDANDGVEPHDADGEADGELDSELGGTVEIVRMNSAAIWLEPPWLGGQPRYVIAIMQEAERAWGESRVFQDRIGGIIANAIADRVAGKPAAISDICLKRALY